MFQRRTTANRRPAAYKSARQYQRCGTAAETSEFCLNKYFCLSLSVTAYLLNAYYVHAHWKSDNEQVSAVDMLLPKMTIKEHFFRS